MPNVLVTSSEDHVCRLWVEVTNHGSDSLGFPISKDRYSKSWTYGHTESTATITLPMSHNHLSSTVVTTSETQASGPVDSCLPARFTYPLPPTLLHHPVLHQLLELWLVDPFSDAQVSIEFARSNAVNGSERLAVSRRSYPRFALATSLALENPSNPNAELSGSSVTGQFVVHWLNNKMYRFDERMKSLLLDSVARSFAIPMDGVSDFPADSSQMVSLVDHLGLFDQSLATILGEWQHAPDVVLCVHPADGSLIVWYVHGLDMSVSNPAGIRTQYTPLLEDGLRRIHLESAFTTTPNLGCRLTHVTTSLRSRLHEAFPLGEAASVLPGIFLFLTATPKSRYNLQMLQTGCTPTSDLFASRDISTLFCRLLVLNHSLQLLNRNPTDTSVHAYIMMHEKSWPQASVFVDADRNVLLEDTKKTSKQNSGNLNENAQLLWSSFDTKVHRAQYVAMVTRHVNGSLRYWRLDVSASSHFQWIVSVNGSARLSGHRFHTEAIVPHPLLPLVLTSSHYSHNSICEATPVESIQATSATISNATSESHSEVILWRVGPVGPLTSTTGSLEHCSTHCHHNTDPKKQARFTHDLSNSSNTSGGNFSEGGLFEVARIDVSEPGQSHTWFDDLAWFPCMVTTSLTSYPVALFLGNLSSLSDSPGTGQLGFFLAFTDTGEDLSVCLNKAHEDRPAPESNRFATLANSDTSGCILRLRPTLPSSSRTGRTRPPGRQCAIPETLLLHVFPSELIPGTKLDQSDAQSTENRMHSTYLIVRLTRWQFAPHQASTRSESQSTGSEETRLEMWRVNVVADTGFAADSGASELACPVSLSSLDELLFGTEKLCDCELPLPEEVSMIRAEVSAAHVSWAALSTYNAPPPYLIASACSDGCLRFWRCDVVPSSNQLADSPPHQSTTQLRCVWSEWQMPLTHTLSSCIELDSRRAPKVLDIDCAYSGRVAVAYAPRDDDHIGNDRCTSALVDPTVSKVLVAVYECESSGGCEWILEDTIDLTADLRHNTQVPVCVQLDWVSTEDGGHLLSIMLGSRVLVYAATCQNVATSSSQGHPQTASTLMTSLGEVYLSWIRVATTHVHTTYVPDPATSSTESPIPISGRHRRVIWLRDGLLLVGVTAEMHVYSQWPSETAGSQVETIPIIGASHALPANKKKVTDNAPSDAIDSVKVTESDVNDSTVSASASLTVARLTKTYSAYLLKPSPSSALLTSPVANATVLSPVISSANKSVATNALPPAAAGVSHSTTQPAVTAPPVDAMYSTLLPNLGLFESIQVFNPVLPQFHPRQLLEWMNFGRLRRVQTILAHLTRCLNALTPLSLAVGPRNSRTARATSVSDSTHQSSRRVSLGTELIGSAPPNNPASSAPSNNVGPVGGAPGGTMLEAQAIPPVPLYVLLAVDSLQAEDLVTSEPEHATAFDPMEEITSFTPTQESELFKIQDDTDSLSDLEAGSPFSQTDVGTHGKYRTAGTGSSIVNKATSSCAAMSMWSLKPTSLAAISQFRPEDARLLADHLAIRQLPGLSPLDQMYLLGIADLMANTQTDITERLSGLESRKKKNEKINTNMSESAKVADVRFHAQHNQVQLYSYLSRTLPPARRAQLLSSGLTNSSSAWAFHSEAEEELLARIPTKQFAAGSEELTWVEFKRYGCGWWIRSDALLRRCAEKIARTAFQSTKDPMESAVFYLAMHKSKILAGLFKSIGNKTLENFFRSDFNSGSPACRQAKLNAFRLLSQHRYMQAAGLFLLADCLDDAVRVCLDTLKDLQLAVVLARLYTSTVPVPENRSTDSPYLRLLQQHVITNEDPFIRSMAFWTLGDPLAALQTLLEGPQPIDHTSTPNSPSKPSAEAQSPQHPQSLGCKSTLIGSVDSDSLPNSRSCGSKTTTSVYPSVFKFYTYLRSHPLVVRQCRLIAPAGADHYALRRLNSLERRLCFRTAHHYSALGCPTLALEVLSKIPALVTSKDLSSMQSDSVSNTSVSGDLVTLKPCSSIPLFSATNLSLSRPQPKPDDNIFTWSADDAFEPIQSSTDRDRFQIEWSDDEKDGTPAQAPCRSGTIPSVRESGTEPISNADFFLFPSPTCTKSEGVGLRQHVWHWLEHELAVVHTLTAANQQNRLICAPDNPDQLRFPVDNLFGQQHTAPEPAVSSWTPLSKEAVGLNDHHCVMNQGPLTTPSFLLSLTPCPSYSGQTHTCLQPALDPSSQQGDNTSTTAAGILLSTTAVSLELRQAEHNRLRTRHLWLKAHEAFLTSLINFCGLYGASGVGLPAVRIELLLLLTELHTYPKCPRLVLSSAHPQPDLVPNQSDPGVTPWSTCTMALVDGIPLLRTVLHLHPGALLLPDPIQHIQCMIQDLMGCLETLPPPYLTTAILPYPYEPNKAATVSAEPTGATIGINPFCAACARAPTPHRQRRVFLLRNLCAALAVCVHQSLSTGGWFGPGQSSFGIRGIALPASSVMTTRSVERLLATKQLLKPNTEPSRWPGKQ
ncbi:uncharacterized protein DEA37_0008487 [Paragonimus westermani]|uniref:RAVE complex protein Rav1 C-terminal domain-containing protein n=1 Tax=Paragonimus westermani TaxID=34504 RepID=A0A5J4NHW8_9TREM|nr:uncharacterized protein DEA37_0008487 [Paragonimus westermani]